MQTEPAPLAMIRAAEVGDVPFIGSTWLQNYWREAPMGTRIRWEEFREGYSPHVQRLLARCEVRVACDPSLPDEIHGYMVSLLPAGDRKGMLVWSYVKPASRNAGIFTLLLATSGLAPDLANTDVVCATWNWLGRTAQTDRHTGKILRQAKPGLEAKFPLSRHQPFRAFEAS